MKIRSAEFVISNTDVSKCPTDSFPEYAFIGRSNVGKSSLLNMLTQQNKLAKTSGKPGKTQLINHFLINEQWYLVDLPGYGFAKASKSSRKKWKQFIADYLLNRENLMNTFILIDSRHEPQKNDLEFIAWCGEKRLPFSIVFTKTDKLSRNQLQKNVSLYKNELLKSWEELPPIFISSSVLQKGRDEILDYIGEINDMVT